MAKGRGVGQHWHSLHSLLPLAQAHIRRWQQIASRTLHPCLQPAAPLPSQAQTAELRGSIDSIKGLVAALEAGHKERASGSADVGDGLTVTELRSELRSFAQTLQE